MKNIKRKGTDFERELVNNARKRGLAADRAYASNGRALGESREVDLIIQGLRIQAKRRKSIAKYLRIPDEVDAVAIRQNRGETYIILKLEDILDKLEAGDW
ncbi:MAG: hypothetical protein U9O96_00035 [Candidatus Thermoplasmatota archaeon]|nr:hypothetical protein [Candidatus Thermoplasmatota archaeon]